MAQQRCPYCGSTRISEPIDYLENSKEVREACKAAGMKSRYVVQNCLDCMATLSPRAFTPGTDEYEKARAKVAGS
jgi:hypothetical protein